jgi:hypothetical protein
VTEDRREDPLGIGAGQGELVGVSDAGRLDLDHVGNCRAHFHGRLPGNLQTRCLRLSDCKGGDKGFGGGVRSRRRAPVATGSGRGALVHRFMSAIDIQL